MLTGTCHCGAVRIQLPRPPRSVTNCNCSICRRYGTLWAYYPAADVRISHAPGATEAYSWGRNTLRFVRCTGCGNITHWERITPRADSRLGVNARLFEPRDLGSVRIRLLDAASNWEGIEHLRPEAAA